ncbi:MAG: restriction endonuclease subunit S [Spirochaetaceae bacterium]|nr:restriction endonuclease subunit S [Spirochaetaceae bacterium]
MTAKDLKNALLQEAVQGKLVPQIASEGNAKDLLEEIRKEKGESIPLATARKRSSATPSADSNAARNARFEPISEDEIPFEIPENWCWCRLGEVCTIKGGKRLPMGSSFSENVTNHVYIRVSDMKNNTISLDDLHYISDEVYEKIKNYIITTDDIYMTIVGATIGKCGIIPDCLNNMNLTENAARIIPFLVDKHYLLMCLTTDFCQTQFIEKTKQVGVQKMALTRFSNSILPLPPLAEQKRIVAAIEHFMPLIEEYGKKEAELTALNADIAKTLKNAILQEAVQGKLVPQIASEGNAKDLLEEIKKEKLKLIKEGKLKKEKPLPEISEDEIPFDIPENWCWCRLGEIVDTNIGLTYSPSDIVEKEGIGVLRSNNIQNGKIVYDDLVQVSKKVPEKCLANKGDLLICARNGSRALVGKCALIEENGMVFGAFMAIVRSRFTPYIMYFINSPIYRAKLEGVNTTTINQITQDNLRETLIPLPPFEEQKRIVAAIEQLLTLCEKIGEK